MSIDQVFALHEKLTDIAETLGGVVAKLDGVDKKLDAHISGEQEKSKNRITWWQNVLLACIPAIIAYTAAKYGIKGL